MPYFLLNCSSVLRSDKNDISMYSVRIGLYSGCTCTCTYNPSPYRDFLFGMFVYPASRDLSTLWDNLDQSIVSQQTVDSKKIPIE